MPRTVDHIVETHTLASLLRAAGRPIWTDTLNLKDVFHSDDLIFTEKRDAIVSRIKRMRWYKDAEAEGGSLFYLVDELADAEDAEEFDAVWDAIYDIADYDRVWIATF